MQHTFSSSCTLLSVHLVQLPLFIWTIWDCLFFTLDLKINILQPSVLVFYCCITNYHKVSVITKMYYLTVSVDQGSGHRLTGSSAQSLTSLKSRCWLRLWSCLKLTILFQDHWLLAEDNLISQISVDFSLTYTIIFLPARARLEHMLCIFWNACLETRYSEPLAKRCQLLRTNHKFHFKLLGATW